MNTRVGSDGSYWCARQNCRAVRTPQDLNIYRRSIQRNALSGEILYVTSGHGERAKGGLNAKTPPLMSEGSDCFRVLEGIKRRISEGRSFLFARPGKTNLPSHLDLDETRQSVIVSLRKGLVHWSSIETSHWGAVKAVVRDTRQNRFGWQT